MMGNYLPLYLLRGLNKACFIIYEEQSGFMHGRHISNNVRLILDMTDYNDLILDDRSLTFVDFYKAFDTVEHEFMFKAIRFWVFGDFFLKAVQTLYSGCTCSEKLAHGTSQRFDIGRGIMQGCLIIQFLLVTQIMALQIKKGNLRCLGTWQ
jgi:hypothetical protein